MAVEENVSLESVSTQNSEDAWEEAKKAAIMIAEHDYLFSMVSDEVLGLIRELLHWIYSVPGTHKTPSELIAEDIRLISKTNLKPIAGPGENKTND